MLADRLTPTTELTPRKDRLESALARGLREGATRSELRETVYQLVDLYRLQGLPAPRGIHEIVAAAARAVPAGMSRADRTAESLDDRLALIESWSRRRYARAD